jgi:hypothetical protein
MDYNDLGLRKSHIENQEPVQRSYRNRALAAAGVAALLTYAAQQTGIGYEILKPAADLFGQAGTSAGPAILTFWLTR